MPISNVKMLSASKSDVDRQTDGQTDYCNPLAHVHRGLNITITEQSQTLEIFPAVFHFLSKISAHLNDFTALILTKS